MKALRIINYTVLVCLLFLTNMPCQIYATDALKEAELAFGTVLLSLGTATSVVTAILLKWHCQKTRHTDENSALIDHEDSHLGRGAIAWTTGFSLIFLGYGSYLICSSNS